ncbi:lytic transglycosylase [Salmonella enterica subsp. enterica]|nr:lytic transglycosylase [Salmonella enterica subsp. enterica]
MCLFIFCYTALASDCFDMAGKDAGIDPDLLRAIAWQESRLHYRVIGKNPVAGYGMGLMQIDSQHLPAMSARGINRELLTTDICINIYSGTYILARAFNKWGPTWEAVGAYNAGFAATPKQYFRRMVYARKIYIVYWKLKHGENRH